jgi:hypothetical protein
MHGKMKFAHMFGLDVIMLFIGVGAQSFKLRDNEVRIAVLTDLSVIFELHPHP